MRPDRPRQIHAFELTVSSHNRSSQRKDSEAAFYGRGQHVALFPVKRCLGAFSQLCRSALLTVAQATFQWARNIKEETTHLSL